MTTLEYFTVVSAGINAISVDYVDAGVHPDSKPVYAFVEFKAREKSGTVHWLTGLTPPAGVILDPITGRYRSEDGKLSTIVGRPINEVQLITPTANPYTLAYLGVPTPGISQTADPGAVQAALETIPALTGNVYVYRVAVNERQKITIGGLASGGVFPLGFNGATTVNPISRNANAGTIQQALQGLVTVGNEGCSVVGPVGGPWEVEFTGLLAGQDVPLMISNSAGLTPTGTIVISTLTPGSSTAPHKVNFVGALQGTDVAQLTATGASISTQTAGDAVAGIELVAATPVLNLPIDPETDLPVPLIYDVSFSVPDLDPKKKDRLVGGFGFVAPTVGGTTVDLAVVPKIPLVR